MRLIASAPADGGPVLSLVLLAGLTLVLLVAAMTGRSGLENRGALARYVAFATQIVALYIRMLGNA